MCGTDCDLAVTVVCVCVTLYDSFNSNITHHIQPHRRLKGRGLMMRRVGMRVERVMRIMGMWMMVVRLRMLAVVGIRSLVVRMVTRERKNGSERGRRVRVGVKELGGG